MTPCGVDGKNGASEGIRTLDVHLGKVMLYQLSYARIRKFVHNSRSPGLGKRVFHGFIGWLAGHGWCLLLGCRTGTAK